NPQIQLIFGGLTIRIDQDFLFAPLASKKVKQNPPYDSENRCNRKKATAPRLVSYGNSKTATPSIKNK
ncbi:MAG TPA: hypothetical protein VLL96_05695, partial [Candidatus Deferrimicrobiaceae bacterium]|nr:hypothetical protein [Candidatus Deferrimicrobiaceae bacterium]